jgi:hypothetical protein
MGVSERRTPMELEELRLIVEKEIENYRYPSSTETIGIRWTDEKVRAELAVMKSALVSPYWSEVELRDTHEQIAASPALSRTCAVVADDLKGTLLVFDPIEGEFMLAVRHLGKLSSIGVRGDGVGCFMAR